MYKVILTSDAGKEKEMLPPYAQKEFNEAVAKLAADPYPSGGEKVSLTIDDVRYVRVNEDIRVAYSVHPKANLIRIIKIINKKAGGQEDQAKEKKNSLIISYMALRRWIGVLGFLLPVFLVLSTCREQGGLHIKPSISDYYYSSRGDFFVVILCVIGIFLLTYKGYFWKERLFSVIAGICAILVAFNPTTYRQVTTKDNLKNCCDSVSISAIVPEGKALNYCDTLYCYDTGTRYFGKILGSTIHRPNLNVPKFFHTGFEWHLLFAAIFLICLAVMSLFFFTRTANDDPHNIMQKGKRTMKGWRNFVYKICGWTIFVCLSCLIVYFASHSVHRWVGGFPLTFIMETVSVWAFAVSWLVKGEAILSDEGNYFKASYQKAVISYQIK
jgi:hypothetical protein